MIKHYENRELPKWLSPGPDREAYLPGEGLKAALDVALELHMPLLLTGEPGTGKTRFAYHLAQHFGLGEVLRFDAKTTSTATDLFYFYDALRHYRLSQQGGLADKDLEGSGIVRLQALGEAIRIAQQEKRRSVVLIDEIDKAPRDFPNDLLNVLEGDFRFSIPETDQEYAAPPEYKPLVVITSNSEKNLPEPFLRRCVFYHIPYPSAEAMLAIVGAKLQELGLPEAFSPEELSALLERFGEMRRELEKISAKKPATAELINWLAILHRQGLGAADFGSGGPERQAALSASLSVAAKSPEALQALHAYYGLPDGIDG